MMSNVLVIDDTGANRQALSKVLQTAGYMITEGRTAADAVRLAEHQPDLIIMGVRLPDASGFTVARGLRGNAHTSSIPLLLTSSTFASPETRADSLDSGADGYLTHPVEPVVLVATVRALLRGRQAERALRESEERLRALSEGQRRLLARERLTRFQADVARRDADVARALAEEASTVKSKFLASMSHELRTPLNAIGGYVELMQFGIRGPITDTQREDLGRIKRNQRHLLRLIDGILNFVKLEAGHIEYRLDDVSVREVLVALEPLVAPQIDAKSLGFTCRLPAEDLRIRGDEDKVQQILLNFVSNAIKFTDVHGRITVETGAEERWVDICVSDTGRGIPAHRLDAIFEPFVQVKAAGTTEPPGTGLGLSISRDLARGMAGDLRVTSRLGEGSTFRLRLPRA